MTCFTGTTYVATGLVATDGTLDPECAALCAALAQLPGVDVVAACSGHSAGPMHVWVTVEDMRKRLSILYFSMWDMGWQKKIEWLCECCPPRLHLWTQTTTGSEAYRAAEELTRWIQQEVKSLVT